MRVSRPMTLGMLFVLIGLLAGPVAGQAPTRPGPDILTADTLTAAQRTQLREYVDYQVARMLAPSTEPDALTRIAGARQNLIQLTRGAVSPQFRVEYTRILEPLLDPVLTQRVAPSGDAVRNTVNSIIVLSTLHTDQAIDMILLQVDSNEAACRRFAARGVARAVMGFSRGTPIQVPTINGAARELARAAEIEEDPGVLRRQLQALATAQQALTQVGEPVEVIRNLRFEVVRMRLDALNGRDDLDEDGQVAREIVAIIETLSSMRDELLVLPAGSQRDVGPSISKRCVKLFEVAASHWDDVHDDPDYHSQFQDAIRFCESLVQFIDNNLNGGSPGRQPDMVQPWRERERAEFEQGVDYYVDLMQHPFYRDAR